VVCSKGTYIRSLAKDLGEKLGVGGYLKELVRTQVGGYKLENAFQLEQLVDQINSEK
jgi:tRNA pseudouridine55 synthase